MNLEDNTVKGLEDNSKLVLDVDFLDYSKDDSEDNYEDDFEDFSDNDFEDT